MLDGVTIPKGWADPIIHSWGKTGNLEKALRDGIKAAEADRRYEDAQLTAMTPADIAQAMASAENARANAEQTRIETEQKRLQAEQAEKSRAGNLLRLGTMIQNLDALQQDAADNGGWFETGYTGSLMRERPGTAAYDLGGRVTNIQGGQFIDALRELKSQSPTGSTGAGGLTEQEGTRILSATGNLDPNQSQGQFLDQINQAREAALQAYRRLGGNDPSIDPQAAVDAQRQAGQNQPAPGERMDRSNPLVQAGDQPEQKGFAQDYREEVDPIRKGVAAKIGSMVAQGRPDAEVIQFLRANGYDPSTFNLGEVLRYRTTPQYKVWQRANPGKAYPVDPSFYTNKIPLSTGQKIGNAAGQSALGAYAINAAQGLTGNRLDWVADKLGGDGEAVNTGVQLKRFPNIASALPYAWDSSDPDREDVALANKVYGARLGNEHNGVGDDDGWKYRGRGPQITGLDNYRMAERGTGLPLVSQPELASKPENFTLLACEFWDRNACNMFADGDSLTLITERVNGGRIGLAERKVLLGKAKKVLL